MLTPQQAADMLEVTEKTLANWRCQKVNIPFIKLGRMVRYDSADVQRWLQDNRQMPSVTSALMEEQIGRL